MVLFAPEDLELVRGDPAERRRYLDDLLVARQPRFAGVRADYDRVLKQRNALLRTAYLTRKAVATGRRICPPSTVWDQHLAQHGAELLAGRLDLCAALAPHSTKAYDAVGAGRGAGRRSRTLARSASGSPATGGARAGPAAALAERRTAEIDRGVTLVGPHRDESSLTLGDLPAKGYASHGESWSFALALRLAAYELLRADGIEPVLALDDVFAELDAAPGPAGRAGRRRRSAARYVRGRSRRPGGAAGRPVRCGGRWRV